jgi:hypothetical protein
MLQALKRYWFILALVLGNMAIAAVPAEAGLTNAWCDIPDAPPVLCCKACVILCRCDLG